MSNAGHPWSGGDPGGVDVGSTGGTHSTAKICQPHIWGEHKGS